MASYYFPFLMALREGKIYHIQTYQSFNLLKRKTESETKLIIDYNADMSIDLHTCLHLSSHVHKNSE